METLAIKYRPNTWSEVVEQSATKLILEQQLTSGEIKNAYLFCGGAGTGKTTCARIFANEINKHCGTPIELDAASNNSVDDIRNLIEQAKTAALDSDYKVFIMDEVHALSNQAWQAMLKILEEPPKKSVFIMCTTDPQKIPKTILSRVQRYDFQRISQKGVFDRLHYIALEELGNKPDVTIDMDALEYIAKLAEGGMRDAITMLDKCIAYSPNITLENVSKTVGTSSVNEFMALSDAIIGKEYKNIIKVINDVHFAGKDLKLFVKQYLAFVLDVNKYGILNDFTYLNLPKVKEVEEFLNDIGDSGYDCMSSLLDTLIDLNAKIKWDTMPKMTIEATLLSFAKGYTV